jgi:hypothetical protein
MAMLQVQLTLLTVASPRMIGMAACSVSMHVPVSTAQRSARSATIQHGVPVCESSLREGCRARGGGAHAASGVVLIQVHVV